MNVCIFTLLPQFSLSAVSAMSSHVIGRKLLPCGQPLNVCLVTFIPLYSKGTHGFFKLIERAHLIQFIRYVGAEGLFKIFLLKRAIWCCLRSFLCQLLLSVCGVYFVRPFVLLQLDWWVQAPQFSPLGNILFFASVIFCC